ncbi:MAG: hypothetical protein HYR91_08225 [Flavobacteriia bacterium]|nr:hypothetical protein [Flavobacteriia bacterium]
MFKNLFYFILIFIISISCKEKSGNKYYYNNGQIIKDTNQIVLLELELKKIFPKNIKYQHFNIKTTLSKKYDLDFQKISDSYKKYVFDTLIKTYPHFSNYLDSLNKLNRVSQNAIIVLNNKSGQIENLAFNNSNKDAIYTNRIENKAIKPYGYILTFEKSKNLNDTYSESILSKVDKQYRSQNNYTVAQSFSIIPGGSIMLKPYCFYPKSDWENLKKRLDINLDLKHFRTGIIQSISISTSLYDLSKTISIIQNNGNKLTPLLIKSITTDKNKIIYKVKKQKNKKAINKSTVIKMKNLFDYYMKSGIGRAQIIKNGIIEDGFSYCGSQDDYLNWCIYSNENYTIGLIEFNSLRTNEFNENITRKEQIKVSYMLKEILKSLNCNKIEGEIYKQIKKQEIKDKTLVKELGL